MFVLLCFYLFVAAASYYAVSRAAYPRLLSLLHFAALLAAGLFWPKVTDPDFVKTMFFATGKTVEESRGFGVAAYFASFAGGLSALLFQGLFHLLFGYLIGSCTAITRLALFGVPKTR